MWTEEKERSALELLRECERKFGVCALHVMANARQTADGSTVIGPAGTKRLLDAAERTNEAAHQWAEIASERPELLEPHACSERHEKTDPAFSVRPTRAEHFPEPSPEDEIARYRAAGDKWAAAVSTGGSVVWSPEKAAARDPGGADIGCMFYGSNDGACHASERERAIVCRAPDKICDRAACLAPLLDDHTRPTVAP